MDFTNSTTPVPAASTSPGTVFCDSSENLSGAVSRDLSGDSSGDLSGSVSRDLSGDLSGDSSRDLSGSVSRDLFGDSSRAVSRDESLDIARGIGIILVVSLHVESISVPARIFIVSFIMPFFFVLSGLLLYIKQEELKPLTVLAERKLKTILLPYLLFSIAAVVVYVFYMYLRFFISHEPVVPLLPYITTAIRYFVTLFGSSVLWFLPALFGSELIFLMIRKNAPNAITIINVCALTVVARFAQANLDRLMATGTIGTPLLFFHVLIRIAYAVFFVMAGYEFGVLTAVLTAFMNQHHSNKHAGILPVVQFICGLVMMTLGTYLGFTNGSTDMRSLYIGEPYLYFPAAVLMSIGLILICKTLSLAADFFLFRFLRFLGRDSLFIMCTHLEWYILLMGTILADFAMKRYPVQAHRPFVYPAMIIVFTLIGETILIIIKNRIKRFITSKRKS